jgi:hypothetical protein
VLQSTAPLQLKRFKVGSKMVIAASAPVLPNQKKNSVAKSLDLLMHPVQNVESTYEVADPLDYELLFKFICAKIAGEAKTKLLARTHLDNWQPGAN